MIKVGITGGIGSGKTHICEMFKALGVPVYNADERAKWLMQENQSVREQIIQVFGKEAYQDQKLNREFLAKVVFQDKEMLSKLNGIVHPAVAIDAKEWHEAHRNEPYTIKEAALLF